MGDAASRGVRGLVRRCLLFFEDKRGRGQGGGWAAGGDAVVAERGAAWLLALAGGGRRVCPGALRRLDAWLDGRWLQDATLAAYRAALTSLRRIPDEEEPRE